MPLSALDLDRQIPVLTKTMIRMSKYLIEMSEELERKEECKVSTEKRHRQRARGLSSRVGTACGSKLGNF